MIYYQSKLIKLMKESIADFPNEMESFSQILSQIKDLNSNKIIKSGDIAVCMNNTKEMIVRAENSRLMANMLFY